MSSTPGLTRRIRDLLTAVYSSGAIGRLVPHDVVGFVRYLKEHS